MEPVGKVEFARPVEDLVAVNADLSRYQGIRHDRREGVDSREA